MAYTLSEFLLRVEKGRATKITNVTPNSEVTLSIGGRTVILTQTHLTKSLTKGVSSEVVESIRFLDLGELFSIAEVLSSDSLKKAISDEVVVSEAGTVAIPAYEGIIDMDTGNKQTITTEHSQVHAGQHFTSSDYDSAVATAAPKYWLLIAPDTTTRCHFLFVCSSSNAGIVEVYEDPTVSSVGSSPITSLNNDRNSVVESEMLAYADPTISSDGTLIFNTYLGFEGGGLFFGSSGGGLFKRESEFILKQGESYVVKFTPANNDTAVTFSAEWYEVG